ncbi:MAG: hypothetical protein FJ100_09155 [Deltaproteobacteria bacterium]|nr:hypothetical protein [Deltaproteobacteria bacterium]
MPTPRTLPRLALAAALATCALPASALVTAPPRAWRLGAYVVPLEDLDLATSDLQASALNNSNSSYPAATKDGMAWPLDTSGMLVVSQGGAPSYPVAFYNQPWSPDGNASKGAPILAKSETLATPAKLHWNIAPAIHSNRLRAVLMGTNIFDKQVGKKLGRILIHRSGQPDVVRELLVGTDVRHFKSGDPGSGLAYALNQPAGAPNLWTGKCANSNVWCYVDQVVVDIPAAEVKVPIIGVTVEAYRLVQGVSGTGLSIHGAMRLHGLTFEASYEATNGGQTVQKLAQYCTSSSPWASDRYGGRLIGGHVYGPKRNIAAIGCGLTSATMVVNYHNGTALTPGQLNTELQEHNGFAASNVGTVANVTASVQQACATLSASTPLNACNCCQGAACATACPGGNPPNLGNDADEVRMCCTLAGTTGIPQGGALAVGSLVEFYAVAGAELDPVTNSCGNAGPARPAVVSGNGTPVISLEVSATAHPFDQTGCAALNHPAFAGISAHPTTHLPCDSQLILANVVALNGTPTLVAGASLRYFQNVDWSVIAARKGLQYTPKMQLTANAADEARQVEFLYAQGTPPILRVKSDSHFLVGTGTVAAWQTDAVTTSGLFIPSGGGFAGSHRVADPGKIASNDLVASMTGAARNLFSGWRLLAPGTPGATLSVTIHSPAELLATDGAGKQCGQHPQLGLLRDIAGCDYGPVGVDVAPDEPPATADTAKQLVLPAGGGPYKLAVVGTGFGAYWLEVRTIDAKGGVQEVWLPGTTKPGAVQLFGATVAASGKPELAPEPAADQDGDGFAAPADCNDADKAVGPQANEVCGGSVDSDCDGLVGAADPSCDATQVACPDADGDGYAACGGNCKLTKPCGDCDDGDAKVSPAGKEGPGFGLSCVDGRDNDCDGAADLQMPACAAAAANPLGSDALQKAVQAAQSGADAGAAGDVGADAGSAGDGEVVAAEDAADAGAAPVDAVGADDAAAEVGVTDGAVADVGAGGSKGDAGSVQGEVAGASAATSGSAGKAGADGGGCAAGARAAESWAVMILALSAAFALRRSRRPGALACPVAARFR